MEHCILERQPPSTFAFHRFGVFAQAALFGQVVHQLLLLRQEIQGLHQLRCKLLRDSRIVGTGVRGQIGGSTFGSGACSVHRAKRT